MKVLQTDEETFSLALKAKLRRETGLDMERIKAEIDNIGQAVVRLNILFNAAYKANQMEPVTEDDFIFLTVRDMYTQFVNTIVHIFEKRFLPNVLIAIHPMLEKASSRSGIPDINAIENRLIDLVTNVRDGETHDVPR